MAFTLLCPSHRHLHPLGDPKALELHSVLVPNSADVGQSLAFHEYARGDLDVSLDRGEACRHHRCGDGFIVDPS